MYTEWLTNNNLPEEVRNILLDPTFPFRTEIGSVRFYTKSEIMEFNTRTDWLPKFLDSKLLAFADAINGDYWVIDFRKENISIAVIPHDDSVEGEYEKIPDELIIKIADSFESFLQMAKDDKVPIDFYEAKDSLK